MRVVPIQINNGDAASSQEALDTQTAENRFLPGRVVAHTGLDQQHKNQEDTQRAQCAGHFPAACFRIGRHVQHGGLRRGVQRAEAFHLDQHCVVWDPGLYVVEVFQVLVGLPVKAGGAGAHVAFNHPRGHGCTRLRLLDLHRLRANQLGDLGGAGAVGAPLDTAQVTH